MMFYGTRCLRGAAAAIGLLALTVSGAQAAQSHLLKPGETLEALARRYKVTVKDIAAANHIADVNHLPDHIKLIIPAPPHKIVVQPSMKKPAAVHGDRVSVRMGPGESHRRLTMFDAGAPLVVTAVKEGWAQVKLPDGTLGWVRQDLLAYAAPNGKTHPAGKAPNKKAVMAARHTAKKQVKLLAKAGRKSSKAHRLELVRKAHAQQLAAARKRHKHAVVIARRHRSHRAERIARNIPEATGPHANSDIIRTAFAYRGTPYRYGGAGRGGFDCSGFTSYLYRKQGVALPHSARAQFHTGRKVGKNGLKPGDLVFFHTVTSGISHVGMYVGNGKFVHSSSRRSGGVRVDSLNSGYYNQRFRGAVRVKKSK